MTIHEAIKTYPEIETELLLANILGKTKEFLYINPTKKLTESQTKKLLDLIKRRQKNEPIAYILGYKYFYGLKFKVNKHTLIPRPETEWLVDTALEIIKSRKSQNTKYQILDLGTGSGCIAITITKGLSLQQGQSLDVTICGADVSSKALTIAKTNAKTHHAKIKFTQSNLFSNINQKFDLIIANLPYVPIDDYNQLKENLKYEPKSAITDGTNTNKIYTKFFEQVSKHLNPKATILLEIDPTQKTSLPSIAKTNLPNSKTTLYEDLQNLYRYAKIKIG
jgi:release factor glutamine methyltransferase